MKSITLVCLIFVLWNPVFSQPNQSIRVSVSPCFGDFSSNLLDTTFYINTTDSVRFETIRFYVSGIELLNKTQTVWCEKNSFHLIDAAILPSQSIILSLPENINYDAIRFNLGIDSTTNVSGALGGDLDPTKGMYWTWQSGYINMKFEGKSNLVNNPNHQFEFHLGGYTQPFNALQTITLKVESNKNILLLLDLKKALQTIALQNVNHVVSPNENAVALSSLISKCFRLP